MKHNLEMVERPMAKLPYSKRVITLLKRDGHYCWLCGKKFLLGANPSHPAAPSIDHVIEKRNGGWDALENLKLAHRSCNSARQQRFPHTNKDDEYIAPRPYGT